MGRDTFREQLEAIPGYLDAERRALPGRVVALAIARIRAQYDLTQAQLAERIGTTQSVIARLESGRRAPSSKVLNQIADAFDLVWNVTFEPRSPAVGAPQPATQAKPTQSPTHVAWRYVYTTVHAAKAYGGGVAISYLDMDSAFRVLAPDHQSSSDALMIREEPAFYSPAKEEFHVIRDRGGSAVPVRTDDSAAPPRATRIVRESRVADAA